MKWDIDKALRGFEPESAPGTCITRVCMDVASLKKYAIKPTAGQLARGFANVWCVGLGYSYAAKSFFYAHTIRECYLKARKAAKAGVLAQHTPWGQQDFKPTLPRKKPRDKKGPKGRQQTQPSV